MLEGKRDYVPQCLNNVFNALFSGRFGNLSEMHEMLGKLKDGQDPYIVCWDFQSYVDCQGRVDECYRNQKEWIARSIKSTAFSGKVFTDRTIKEYADLIWYVTKIINV